MGELLSQSEIDALLAAVEKGEVGEPRQPAEEKRHEEEEKDKKILPYDITNPDLALKGRLPLLKIIHERFCRLFRNSLSELLQKICDVELADTRGMRFGEFLSSLSMPTCISLLSMKPLDGSGLLILDSQFIFVFIDIFCGGSGKGEYKIEGREFTPIELKLARRVVEHALNDMKEAWRSVHEIDFSLARMEVNPQFVNVIPPEENILVAEFNLDVEGPTGKMTLVIPYFSLEPLRGVLGREYMRELRHFNAQWKETLEQHVLRAKVELKPILGHAVLSLKKICELEPGDIIQLDTWADGLIPMYIEGKPKFFVKPGKSGAYRAVKIEGYIVEH